MVCPNCPYNMPTDEAKNYFAIANFFCFCEYKNYVCSYCTVLKDQLNNYVLKLCVKELEVQVELSGFKLIPLKDYLYKIKAWLFFVFDKEQKKIQVLIENPIHDDIPDNLETYWLIHWSFFNLLACVCIFYPLWLFVF